MLGGKSPEILEAITFSAREPQTGLKATSIAGNSNYRVDPDKDDFFKRLIDLRTSIKARLRNSIAKEALNSDQQALKILANSTSYGIFVEMIVRDLDAPERLICHGPAENEFPVESKKVEEQGRYFHPLLATLITGAARLMLGIAERLCAEKGLDWAFCDTDSQAIAKPEGMDQAEFFERAQSICEWFSPLNPYEKKGRSSKSKTRTIQFPEAKAVRNSSRFTAIASPPSATPCSIADRPAKSSFARPPLMGWGNTSSPMKPMMHLIQFPRRQSPWTTSALSAGNMTHGTWSSGRRLTAIRIKWTCPITEISGGRL